MDAKIVNMIAESALNGKKSVKVTLQGGGKIEGYVLKSETGYSVNGKVIDHSKVIAFQHAS